MVLLPENYSQHSEEKTLLQRSRENREAEEDLMQRGKGAKRQSLFS
jgi:hypothetical protein